MTRPFWRKVYGPSTENHQQQCWWRMLETLWFTIQDRILLKGPIPTYLKVTYLKSNSLSPKLWISRLIILLLILFYGASYLNGGVTYQLFFVFSIFPRLLVHYFLFWKACPSLHQNGHSYENEIWKRNFQGFKNGRCLLSSTTTNDIRV